MKRRRAGAKRRVGDRAAPAESRDEGTTPGPPPSGAGSGRTPRPAAASTAGLFRTFLLIGATAFGMSAMQSVRSTPVKRGWLTQQDVDEGFGVVQLFPGAIVMDLVAFIGYRLRGIRGAVAAAAGFLTPSLVLLLGLSWAYFTYGTRPGVGTMVVGLNGLVIGVLASVTIDFGAEHAHAKIPATLAIAAFIISAAGGNVLWAVLGAFVVGALALRGEHSEDAARAGGDQHWSWRRVVLASTPAAVVAAGVTVAALGSGALGAVTVDMAKIGSIAFGNGTVILPVLQQDAVAHHWLTVNQFGAGVAFGQITPGPILITAVFVGFAAAGWWGAIAAGVAIFAPSVAMTIIVGEIYPYLRRLRWVRGAITGIMAAFTGLLAGMILILGAQVVQVPAALGLAGAALIVLRVFKPSPLAIFAAGMAVWAVYLALGGPQ